MIKKYKKIYFLLLFLFIFFKIEAQDTINNETILNWAEVMPSFPNGSSELFKFLNLNIIYPKTAQKTGIEGKVISKFYVDIDGNIKNPTIIKSLGNDFDNEVLRVLSIMPKWNTGTMSGKKVNVYFTLPVSFKLKDEKIVSDTLNTPEKMPSFPGDSTALLYFLAKNISYPIQALEKGIKGKVIVTFIVDIEGYIQAPKIIKGIGGGCEEEVLRVLSIMPQWIPGKDKGVPINTYFTLPITFF